MTKRILIFSTAYFPLVGGAEIAVKEITKRMPDCEFVLITAKIKKELPALEKIDQVTVYRIGTGNFFDKIRLIFQGVKKAEALGKFDVVWSIMASYGGFAGKRYKNKHPQTTFVLSLQEGDNRWHIYSRVWWCWLSFKQIFKRADKIQAISNHLGKWAKKMGATAEIKIIPNGVDGNLFKKPDNFSANVKEQNKNYLGLKNEDKIIFTASRLTAKNGLADLIASLVFLPDNYKLLIAGSGELLKKLTEIVKDLKLNKRVIFLGAVPHEDLPGLLWLSDVFCRPSLSEGLGNSFLEAMTAGVPIIGTKVGGIPDFLLDGETGLFGEKKNPRDLADKIQKIINDLELRNKIIVNARNLIDKKYTWEIVTKQLKELFF